VVSAAVSGITGAVWMSLVSTKTYLLERAYVLPALHVKTVLPAIVGEDLTELNVLVKVMSALVLLAMVLVQVAYVGFKQQVRQLSDFWREKEIEKIRKRLAVLGSSAEPAANPPLD
jgi:NAD/NADP transhydrogenase beta subunit